MNNSRPNRCSAFMATLACLAAPSLAFDADGTCFEDERNAGLCFVSPNGFTVEAVTGANGEFPIIDADGNSVFSYYVTGPDSDGQGCQDISHADILLPECGDNPLVVVDSMPESETPSDGDQSCGFGVGDNESFVLKWNRGVSCGSSEVFTVVIAGVVDAEPTSFLLKEADRCNVATILGPSCSTGPFTYCESTMNSSGNFGRVGWSGSLSISDNNFVVSATGLPPGKPGYFFFGTSRVQVPFGDGFRCLGGSVARFRKIGVNATGGASVQLDFTLPPLDQIEPGVPYYFQLYFRDGAGGAGFNTTDALCVSFVP